MTKEWRWNHLVVHRNCTSGIFSENENSKWKQMSSHRGIVTLLIIMAHNAAMLVSIRILKQLISTKVLNHFNKIMKAFQKHRCDSIFYKSLA